MDKNSANKISFRTSLVGHDLHWFGKSLHTLDKNSANRIRFRTSPVRRDQNLGRRRFYALNKNGANRICFRTSPVGRDRNQGRRKFALQKKNKADKARFRTSPVAVWPNSGMAEDFPERKESWEPGGPSRRRNAAWHWRDEMGCAGTGIFAGQRLDLYRGRNISRKDDGGCIHGQKAVQT